MTTNLTTKLMIRLGPGADRPEFLEAVDTATDSAALVLVDRDAAGGVVDLETDDAMTTIASVLDVATAHGIAVLSIDELVTHQKSRTGPESPAERSQTSSPALGAPAASPLRLTRELETRFTAGLKSAPG
jgi:hypothetical protein